MQDAKTRTIPIPILTKELWIQFVEAFLGGVEFIGIQNCYGIRPDQILFRASSCSRSTLAVDFNVMLLPQKDALEVVQRKIRSSELAFKGVA